MTIIAKRTELANILALITAKQAEIDAFEYESSEDEYDSHLDDVYGQVEICGYTYGAAYALKELDPTAYRCGKSDHDSSMDLDDIPEYKALTDELEELENQRDDLEVEIEDLEAEEEENEE